MPSATPDLGALDPSDDPEPTSAAPSPAESQSEEAGAPTPAWWSQCVLGCIAIFGLWIAAMSPSPERLRERIAEQAATAWSQEDAVTALLAWERLIGEGEEDPVIRFSHVLAMIECGDRDRAGEWMLQLGNDLTPETFSETLNTFAKENQVALVQLWCLAAVRSGDNALASSVLNRAIPVYPPLALELARLHALQGQPLAAKRAAQTAYDYLRDCPAPNLTERQQLVESERFLGIRLTPP